MSGRLEGRLVGLGVCGSIAAYKAVELLRLLRAEGADVVAMLTPSAATFVGPLTFAALSRHPVETDASVTIVVNPKITILVEEIEKMGCDDSVSLVAQVGADLLEQMLTQRAQPGHGLVESGMTLCIEASVVIPPGLRLAAKIDRPVAVLSPLWLPMLGRIGCEFAREHFRRCG